MERTLFLVFLGPPGSGKGTQGKLVHRTFAIAHVATGDVLRQEVQAGTPLGQKAQAVMERGALLDDRLIIDMVTGHLVRAGVDGWVLDGFPRTVVQAEALEQWLTKRRLQLTAAVNFEIDDEEVVRRLSGRWTCQTCGECFHSLTRPPWKPRVCDVCGGELLQRVDDRAETVRERIRVYRQATATVVDYYAERKLLWSIPAIGTVDAIFGKLKALIERRPTKAAT